MSPLPFWATHGSPCACDMCVFVRKLNFLSRFDMDANEIITQSGGSASSTSYQQLSFPTSTEITCNTASGVSQFMPSTLCQVGIKVGIQLGDYCETP